MLFIKYTIIILIMNWYTTSPFIFDYCYFCLSFVALSKNFNYLYSLIYLFFTLDQNCLSEFITIVYFRVGKTQYKETYLREKKVIKVKAPVPSYLLCRLKFKASDVDLPLLFSPGLVIGSQSACSVIKNEGVVWNFSASECN